MSKTGGVTSAADVASAPTVALPSLRVTPGSVVADRYEIVSSLGEGGMGAVFRVIDRELRDEIALKMLRPEIADAPGMLERFRREVKLARRVTHPNVARTFDLGAFQGIRYLTMELVPGESIARRYSRGKRAPLPEALRIAAEVAKGLGAAHSAGVIHRDLKPDNVLLHNDRVVITDFGIARQQEQQTGTVGAIVGTPAYMSPEQLEGREICGRSDVYALGLMLFELLTGTPAFEGDTLYSIAAARLSGEPPNPRKRDASVPEPVAKLVHEMIAKNRNDRPDAQMVVDRLDALRGGAAAIPESAPRVPSAGLELIRVHEPKPLAILPLVATEESARSLASELSEALGDAIAKVRGVRVIPAARLNEAGTVIEGSVRIVGNKVRARVRMIDVERGAVSWAERVEGTVDDPFALEDDLVRGVTDALHARETYDAARGGPSDKGVREVYDQARALYAKFGTTAVREAIVLLEKGLEAHPGDAWLTSLLGAALARVWLQTGGTDRELIARAEELSLRALAADSTIGETFHTISCLRQYEGDIRAAVRALQETLARAPLHAEAHQNLGKIMIETGYVEEGMKRLELAQRLDGNLLLTWFELARTHALLGDRRSALAALEQAATRGGPMAALFPRLRLIIWWMDRDMAKETAELLKKSQTGATWERALPMADALSRGEFWEGAGPLFEKLANDARGAPKHRAFMYELAAEYFGAFGKTNECLDAIERAAELALIDVFWMDRCPSLASVRTDPRFDRARATVGARAAAVWS